jgi:type III pantothenate kinase
MKKELSADARVVATGGLAELVSQETKTIQEIKPQLTLEGLRLLFEINH